MKIEDKRAPTKTEGDYLRQINALEERISVVSKKRPHWTKRMEKRVELLKELGQRLKIVKSDLAELRAM